MHKDNEGTAGCVDIFYLKFANEFDEKNREAYNEEKELRLMKELFINLNDDYYFDIVRASMKIVLGSNINENPGCKNAVLTYLLMYNLGNKQNALNRFQTYLNTLWSWDLKPVMRYLIEVLQRDNINAIKPAIEVTLAQLENEIGTKRAQNTGPGSGSGPVI